jgi:endonuclease/exonuclease/phosphatase family metal-dependent hydrolase
MYAVPKRSRSSGFFTFAALPPVGLLAIVLFSLSGVMENMPAREPADLDSREIIIGTRDAFRLSVLSSLEEETALGKRPLRVASYNVHKFTGLDFRRDPDRIAAVIRSMDADIVSLQEVLCVESCDNSSSQLRLLAERTGMQMSVAGPTVMKKDGRYGNALLSRFPITNVRLHNISLGAFEPRGIIDADIKVGNRNVRVIATHFGLWPMERNRQARRLLEILPEKPTEPLIVMGDMNCWVPGSPEVQRLYERLGTPATIRSYPAPLPLLSLERIWVLPADHRFVVETTRSRQARIASDHLPMVAAISLAPSM